MRHLALSSLLLCSSCAWLFQDHLPREYSGQSEPMCSTSAGWATVDGVFAVLNVLGAIGAASDDQISDDDRSAYMIGGIIGGLVHVASAGTGAAWASDCRKARAAFDERTREEAARRGAERAAAALRAQAMQPAPTAPMAQPRGFFCSSNATTGFCVRDKAECERTRDISIGALPDLAACALVESAWCTGELCSPTSEACEARRQRTGGDAPCEERR